jgi:hypothetical protein
MGKFREGKTGARAAVTAVALASLLAMAPAGCSQDPESEGAPRGRGTLVSPYQKITSCSKAVYRGPETLLYADRPYRTAERVDAAVGLAFCRGARHGANVWIVEVSKATTFVAFGNEALGLDERGWAPSEEALSVATAGAPLDRIYTKRFAPGRYVIRQGFATSAPVVLWDDEAVRLLR